MAAPNDVRQSLKRLADEDAEDHMAIYEARKRLKARDEHRAALLSNLNTPAHPAPPTAPIYYNLPSFADATGNVPAPGPPVGTLFSSPFDDIVGNVPVPGPLAGTIPLPSSAENDLANMFELDQELFIDDLPFPTDQTSLPDAPAAVANQHMIETPARNKSLFELFDEFRQTREHGDESVLHCGACFKRARDPMLTNCLHIACKSCFNDMLNAVEHNPELVPTCETDMCPEFDADHVFELGPDLFKLLAESVGISINDRDDLRAEFGPLSDAALRMGELYDAAAQRGDVAALKDHLEHGSGAILPLDAALLNRTPSFFVSELIKASRRTSTEDLLDGIHDYDFDDSDHAGAQPRHEDQLPSDDSSSDYSGRQSSDDDTSASSSRSGETDSDSDSDDDWDSDDSDVSATEVRVLRRDWSDEYRETLMPVPAIDRHEASDDLARDGWQCGLEPSFATVFF
ncbi:uncharacterized protein HMPREF1541_01686 [Cyphellophora europaea CBS 101466]|uniref:RING-type domain-containing protein n=1 Tax=Cyphellophora europaea (strain CBS 101466) TaxID=1220924 RepID=W2S3L2_CYPE1|nr:uncharacterized protein HMPREF1541_01686 [Cyphellophora europaea CBS 101466]ETN42529.1 hypothetical protein HMPREF1541_01686 [Cyphellophora europaea CBS 101466]